jgi:hypothetical protein
VLLFAPSTIWGLGNFVAAGAGRDASGTKPKPFSLIFILLRPRLEASPSLALDGAGGDASGTTAKQFSLIFILLRPRLEPSPSLALDGAGRDASGTEPCEYL